MGGPLNHKRGDWGEFDAIAKLFAPLADNKAALGLLDDAAVFTPPAGHDLVITTDALVSDVHFPADADAGLVARRLVACNISDLAAKGAKPVGCLLTLGVGPDWDEKFLTAFAAAFGQALKNAGMPLWGGDTVKTTAPFVSLTAHGIVLRGQMLTRSGAQDGDDIYVTGTIGDGWLDLQTLGPAYTDPQPPLAFGQKLVGLAHAALDVSDGLMADLDHMCRASGGCITIETASLPLSQAAKAHLVKGGSHADLLADLVTGGDDLQIAFAAPPSAAEALIDAAREQVTVVTRIGRFASDNKAQSTVLLDESGAEIMLSRRGYSHF